MLGEKLPKGFLGVGDESGGTKVGRRGWGVGGLNAVTRPVFQR